MKKIIENYSSIEKNDSKYIDMGKLSIIFSIVNLALLVIPSFLLLVPNVEFKSIIVIIHMILSFCISPVLFLFSLVFTCLQFRINKNSIGYYALGLVIVFIGIYLSFLIIF